MQKAIAVERPGSQSGTLDLSSLKVRAQNRGYMYIAPALYVDDDVGVYRQACSGIPLAVGFVDRDRLLYNSMVQGTQKFRQVRAASLRNTLRPMWFVLH